MEKLTFKEKLKLLNGKDLWNTIEIEEKGIKSVILSDGPHGLCRQIGGQLPGEKFTNITATLFPVASAMASTFNPDLIYKVGSAIAKEAKNVGVSLVLGPGVNIKRNPLCGRNFEYYSEDPLLSGVMGKAFVSGIQSENVGACVKHFMGNNQEFKRLVVDTLIDERALNEIYLKPFEMIVKDSKPEAIMTAYNKVNGYHMAESPMIQNIIRKKWKYDGLVISDWGGVYDSIASINSGLDLEMPYCPTRMDYLLDNVDLIDKNMVDKATSRMIRFIDKSIENLNLNCTDYVSNELLEENYKISKEVSDQSIVLLKNNGILPFKGKKLLVVGEPAKKPRYQGGGSSHMNPYILKSPLECLKKYYEVDYALGYEFDSDIDDKELIDELLVKAKKFDDILLFTGLSEEIESEGFDRENIRLPYSALNLISKLKDLNKKVIVVNVSGSVVEMPFIADADAIIQMYYGGETGSESLADIIAGKVNPSGKLNETFIKRIEDSPIYLSGLSFSGIEKYLESIYVGYRYYEKKKMEVNFPFGHGLSYSKFIYSNIVTNKETYNEFDIVRVRLNVKNISNVDGYETVQLYVSNLSKLMDFPIQELKAFKKVFIKSGETKTIEFDLNRDAFRFYFEKYNGWYLLKGAYEIRVGNSSENILAKQAIYFDKVITPNLKVNWDTTLNELLYFSKTRKLALEFMKKYNMGNPSDRVIIPLRNSLFFNYGIKKEDIEKLIDKANKATLKHEIIVLK